MKIKVKKKKHILKKLAYIQVLFFAVLLFFLEIKVLVYGKQGAWISLSFCVVLWSLDFFICESGKSSFLEKDPVKMVIIFKSEKEVKEYLLQVSGSIHNENVRV